MIFDVILFINKVVFRIIKNNKLIINRLDFLTSNIEEVFSVAFKCEYYYKIFRRNDDELAFGNFRGYISWVNKNKRFLSKIHKDSKELQEAFDLVEVLDEFEYDFDIIPDVLADLKTKEDLSNSLLINLAIIFRDNQELYCTKNRKWYLEFRDQFLINKTEWSRIKKIDEVLKLFNL